MRDVRLNYTSFSCCEAPVGGLHGGTLNSRRATSALVRLVEEEKSTEQKGCAAFHSKRESISGGNPTSFPEDTSLPYSGFGPEPTRLQTEGHNHHIGWVEMPALEKSFELET
ncbi:hypothetical protein TNCV_1522261 [Trichonephila clavipes]|nr:hypothetical protein TNCV_1522261 [Trichonephila clavipes]